MTSPSADLIVVGGGLAGLTIAWKSMKAGLRVIVVDPHPGENASAAAAGRLAAVTEAHYGEEPLVRFNVAAAEYYPDFVAELESESGRRVGYRECGSLLVAVDADDLCALDNAFHFHQRLGLASRRMTARDCRELEPLLVPGIRGGILAENDHQVDNRLLVEALLAAMETAAGVICRQRAAGILVERDAVAGVRLDNDETLRAPRVVVAAGGWTGTVGGIPPEARIPVRPVKGQIVRLRSSGNAPLPTCNVQGLVHGNVAYLVPRPDGTMVLGATVEEQGFDSAVTAGALHQLLRDAYAFVPSIAELEVVGFSSAFRPNSPDNAPLIGATALAGMFVASGYYRNGVLLAPLAAELMVTLLVTGRAPDAIAPFSPLRFGSAVAGSAA